jgi:hypothetical protein
MSTVVINNDLKARVKIHLKDILALSFSNPVKRKYYDSHDRLNFACPYCGDSEKSVHKKRGNIFWRNSSYHCFNCTKHVSLDKFLRDFKITLDIDDRSEILKIYKSYQSEYKSNNLEFGLFKELNELAVDQQDLFIHYNIVPINERTQRAYPYLKSRLLHKKLEHFAYNHRNQRLYILNLDSSGKKVISFQTKNLGLYGNRFSSFKLSKIRNSMKLSMPSDEELVHRLDLLSMIFNILRIDLVSEFTIFEGPIDSMFMKNSIALAGANKNSFDFDELETCRYFFDDDPTGKKASINKLKLNSSVFLWDKYKRDYKLTRTSIKDLNQLILYAYKNNKKDILININSYFSNDRKNLIYV